MLAIAQGNDVVDESRRPNGRKDFPVHLARQAQAQRSPETRIRGGHFPQHLPQRQRVAIGRKQTGMGDVEMPVLRRYRAGEVFFVKAVGDAGHRRLGQGLEVLLHERRAGQNGIAAVQHPPLHVPQPFPAEAGHGQVLEVIHLAPRVPEVRNPRNAQRLVKPLPYQMDRMRRPGGDHHIHRMFLQIGLKALDGRAYPAHARVRDKEIGPNPQAEPLFEAFGAGRYFRHLRAFGPGKLAVGGIGLPDGPAEHLHLRRHLGGKGVVQGRVIGVFRCPNHRFPALCTQVFDKLYPALHPRPSGRRPIVCYDQNAPHSPNSSFMPRSRSKA